MLGFATPETAMAKNALLEPWNTPFNTVPFNKLKPFDYEEAIIEGIKLHNKEIDAITSNPEAPTFENTIVALDRAGLELTLAELALGNVEHANGDSEMMEIKMKTTPMLTQHGTDIILNADLFKRIKTVYDNRASRTDLSPEDQRLIELTYKNFAQAGANLNDADREKYRQLSTELSNLGVRFAQNVSNEMKSPENRLWLKADQLAGLPESIKASAREEAKAALADENKPDDESLYLFTMYFPSYSPFMKYAENRDLRKKFYEMYNSRNIGGQYDNVQILKDIANVRLEIAKLFGFDDFSQYQLQETMAGSSKEVYALLNQLKDAYLPAMEKELNELQAFAQQTEGPDFKLEAWDYSFWADRLKKAKYDFNDEDMKPYFELNKTIDGVLGLATKLYGFKFKENKKIPVYHPDVRAYEVYGPDKKLLGVFYADFFYRPGKSPGAWMTEFRPEWKDENGRTVPLISIVCNFSKPVGNEPVLLTPYEVETFLHEFGHSLHGLSAQSKYSSLSGTNVFHDFVELFSQFNENFLPQKEFLDSFAVHYKTGKPMPKELVDKFIKSQQFGAAYACIRQLNFGFLDMAYHTINTPLRASADVAEFEKKAIEPVKIFDTIDGCIISPAFAHIFSGGYASGYYGYKWAELLDADAFQAFQEEGIFNKDVAARFKKMMESGGSADPMELYIQFRGKKPSVDALMIRDGIK